jgi:hypothetical protein
MTLAWPGVPAGTRGPSAARSRSVSSSPGTGTSQRCGHPIQTDRTEWGMADQRPRFGNISRIATRSWLPLCHPSARYRGGTSGWPAGARVGGMRRCPAPCDRRKDPAHELSRARSLRGLGLLNHGARPAPGQAGSLSSSPRKTTAQIPSPGGALTARGWCGSRWRSATGRGQHREGRRQRERTGILARRRPGSSVSRQSLAQAFRPAAARVRQPPARQPLIRQPRLRPDHTPAGSRPRGNRTQGRQPGRALP